jgi:sphingolipid delta-4 desaturase
MSLQLIYLSDLSTIQYQGDEDLDADIPTSLEAKLFCTTFGKVVWMFLQPLFYAFRPLFVRPLPPSMTEIINVIIQLSFDFTVFYFMGNPSNS